MLHNENNNKNIHYTKCLPEVEPRLLSANSDEVKQQRLFEAGDDRHAGEPLHAAPPTSNFINDLTENRRVWRIPWFLALICLLQIALYCVGNESLDRRLIFTPETRAHYYPYLTYMLLHSDLVHLLLNVCLQSMVGWCLESEQGHWQLALIYAVGGVSGSLVTAIFQPQLSIVGASAGVYALLMSHIPHLMKNFAALPFRYLRTVALLILCVSDIGFTSFHFLVNHNTNPRICLEAHIAGGIAGLFIGMLVYRRIASPYGGVHAPRTNRTNKSIVIA